MASVSHSRGFTLIELMISMAIIGLLAAVAIPSYQDYVSRAQVSEATDLLFGVKVPTAEYYTSEGNWPDNLEIGSVVVTLRGKYVSILAVTGGGGSTGQTFQMTVTMKATGVNAAVSNRTIELTTIDGGRRWICASGGANPMPRRYLPGSCQ